MGMTAIVLEAFTSYVKLQTTVASLVAEMKDHETAIDQVKDRVGRLEGAIETLLLRKKDTFTALPE